MAKKPVDLGGIIRTDVGPTDTGIPQRGVPKAAVAAKRAGGKRLSLALDAATYRRLRHHAADADMTHQDILEVALKAYLDNVSK